MTIYRRIYEDHFGPIPTDEFGRTYDIHHIDGNHQNNNPSNLKAVTIQEHYDIHYSQGDYGACYYIMLRMNKTKEEISQFAKFSSLDRWSKNVHHCKGRSWYNNGIEQKMFIDPPSNDWIKGRLNFDNVGAIAGALKQKGKKWFNDGSNEGMFLEGNQPAGWNLGRLPSTKKGKKNSIWSAASKAGWETRKAKLATQY